MGDDLDTASTNSDEFYMSRALELAIEAYDKGEVPIGAVIVSQNQIIAEAFNLREINQSPLAHAEILAIEKASHLQSNWRLSDCTLYVTLEPCPMCAGAILQSRIKRVVYATRDPKAGAVRSLYHLLEDRRLNHQVEVSEGILESDSASLLKKFFHGLRAEKKVSKGLKTSKLFSMWISLWITAFGLVSFSWDNVLGADGQARAVANDDQGIQAPAALVNKPEDKDISTIETKVKTDQNLEIETEKMMSNLESFSQGTSQTENDDKLESRHIKQHTEFPIINGTGRIPEAERLYPPGYKAK